jgi:hypothetical protein
VLCAVALIVPAPSYAEPPSPQITPAPQDSAVTFLNITPPETYEDNRMTVLQGTVYEDLNANGRQDAGELALKGISIGVQIPGREEDAIPVLTVTDAQGRFAISVPTNSVVSVVEPDGWRSVGPNARIAKTEMSFGLRPMQSVIERVMPAPIVNVASAPLDWRMIAVVLAGLFGAVLLLAALILRGMRRQIQAQAELSDWGMQMGKKQPAMLGMGGGEWLDVGSIAQPPQPSLLTQPVAEGNTLLTDSAATFSPPHTLSVRAANDYEAPAHYTHRLPMYQGCEGWGESAWFGLAEQVIADVMRESVKVDSFLGLAPLPNAWMRFSTRDGQILTFALSRSKVQGCRWWEARKVYARETARGQVDLRMLYQHYADAANLPSRLPRHCEWFVFNQRGFLLLKEDAQFSGVMS